MNNKKELLLSYVNANVAPILVDFISANEVKNAVIIPADISKEQLNGHYDNINFLPPKWLEQILKQEKEVLIIDKIDSISKEEQLKFCELLKYRKISTFKLPKNCIILITANKISAEKIHREISSLVVQI